MSRILFVMLHPGFVRYYDQALDALVADGHEVHVAFEVNRTKLGEDITARRLAERSPRLTCGSTPERPESVRDFLARTDREAMRGGGRAASLWSPEGREQAWESLATTVRLLVDYLRFFDPAFARASALRARAEKRVPRVYRPWIRRIARGGAVWRRSLRGVLAAVERMIPPSGPIEVFLRAHDPDLLLVTPLVELGSQQVDYVKAARRLGVPSALCVASWDNLTSKGLIRVLPDRVLVWNEAQKREAVELHGVAPAQVVVTGAHLFDRWFDARPTRSRDEFCRLVGLDPARPFVLYVGSSVFIAPDEVPFAEAWLAALRAGGDRAVARLAVLIRPHPANARQWRAFDAAAFDAVALWPPIGTDPNAPDFHRDYFESLYYSVGAVGINTSAQIEAGIVGRPVFTIQAPEFAHAQQGTLHFRYLVDESGGLVQTADTLDEHVAQLAAAAHGAGGAADRRAFLRGFVRPLGLDAPAAPAFARAIGELSRLPRPRPQDGAWRAGLQPIAFVLAGLARTLAQDRPLWVYAMRPLVAAGVWSWAGAYHLREAWRRGVVSGCRRTGRRVHRAAYEGAQQLRKAIRRVHRRLVGGVRSVGVTVKRAARREL